MREHSLGKFRFPVIDQNKPIWIARGIFLVWLAVLAWHLFVSALGNGLWTVFLVIFILFGYIAVTALGVGRILVRRFNVTLSDLEFNLLAFLLGLGLLSFSIALLGMLGWLNKNAIFLTLAVIGFVATSEWGEMFRSAQAQVRSFRLPRGGSIYDVLLVILTPALFLLMLINVLTPIWDYDALVYHMEIPKQFLSQGRFNFDPNIMRSAHPFLGEMLFVVGMVFQVESVARLVNLTFAIVFIASTYAFACRFFNRQIALVALGILVSTPILSVWATWASIDFAWAAFEFWAVYAILLWLAGEKTDARKWMVLAGIMSGLGASTKYLSLPALGILAIIILWKSMEGSKRSFAEAFWNLLIFGVSATLVMGIWYIKNWLWTGNPIYPLLFGGVGWDALKNQIFSIDYMQTFGMDRTLLNFILLPYYVYAQHDKFSTLPLEIVHPLLWAAFLFPFMKGSKERASIAVYTFLYYIWWFLGAQQIRFLLPISGFLAILAGSVIERFWTPLKHVLKLVLIAAPMILIVVYQLSVLNNSGVFSYLAGRTSSDELLRVFVDDYAAKQFIQESLQENERVMFLWDSRGYYCDSRCIPDSNQSHAIVLALDSPPPVELAHQLKTQGITHILIHSIDAEWFIEHHDPNRYHSIALQYFQEQFLPTCARSIYQDDKTELFELICD